jgi:hypothetical protein
MLFLGIWKNLSINNRLCCLIQLLLLIEMENLYLIIGKLIYIIVTICGVKREMDLKRYRL